jgi:hypothetical protein
MKTASTPPPLLYSPEDLLNKNVSFHQNHIGIFRDNFKNKKVCCDIFDF